MNGGSDGIGSSTSKRSTRVLSSSAFMVVGNPSSHLAYRLMWVTIACVAFWILTFVFGAHGRPPVLFVSYLYGDTQQQQQRLPVNGDCSGDQGRGDPDASSHAGDGLLGGLLAADNFKDESCLSRQEAALYRKASPWKPSSYLLGRLRSYEARHRHCAPHEEYYNKSLSLLQSGRLTTTLPTPECNYVIWTPRDGLGNRMLSLVSAFLYTLLTGRVLLIDSSKDMADLFCEPFPGSTWLLPPDFPLGRFHEFDKNHPQSYGNMLKKNSSVLSGDRIPGFVYLYLAHNYDDDDKAFFWEGGEGSPLQKIPWMVVKSNQYFVPALFLNPAFEGELRRLFPEKEAVFHHLGRYLFHPTNAVWGLITRYYRAYLATAGERIGIQIRVFNKETAPFEVVLRQILNCTLSEKLLPEVKKNKSNLTEPAAAGGSVDRNQIKRSLKAVLLTSLSPGYLDRIKDIYWEQPAAGGGADVSVHQPSHEEWQQTEKGEHDMKALAEMYLLSLSDALVTSAWSTFGYVAQALGGLRPWILLTPGKGRVPEPACVRAMSSEPCFHYPPSLDGREKRKGSTGRPVVPYVKHCEDTVGGLKLVGLNEASHG